MTTYKRNIIEHRQHTSGISSQLAKTIDRYVPPVKPPVDPEVPVDPELPVDPTDPIDPETPIDPVLPPPEEVEGETVIQSFDNAIVRYKWTEIGGRDLDTRTYFLQPNRSNKIVGWSRLSNDENFLLWNQDNTGSGVESVLIDIQKMIAAYPDQENFQLILRAWWYRSCNNGNLTIEFTSYKGGSMVRDGFDWKNVGGQAVQVLTVDTNTRIQMSSGLQEGEHLATVNYNPQTGIGSMTKDGSDTNPDLTPPAPPVDSGGSTDTPIQPDAAGMTYRVMNNAHVDAESTTSLSIDGVSGQWALFDDGIAIASNNYISDDVTVSIYRQNVYLTLVNTPNTIKNYKLVAVASTVTVGGGSVDMDPTARSIEILSFSRTIFSHRFSAGGAKLTVPTELPSYVISMAHMFSHSVLFNQDISTWNVSNVVDMSYAFNDCKSFNQNIGVWDVSGVTAMNQMFSDCVLFNGDISSWNTSLVTNMSGMFSDTLSFTHSLNTWDTSNVTTFGLMFYQSNYNSPIGAWDTSSVTNMSNMFTGNKLFNQNIDNWNVSNVVNISSMFENATAFNQPLNQWVFVNLRYATAVFKGATSFNQNINDWNVSAIEEFTDMFSDAISFNQDLSKWNTVTADDMNGMFRNCISLNQDLSGWCTPNVRYYDHEEFNLGAVNWGLPKPSWGTCPRGEDVGNVYVPPEPIEPGLDFTTKVKTYSDRRPIIIYMENVEAPWKLMHGNRVVCEKDASPNGLVWRDKTFYREGVDKSVKIELGVGTDITQYRLITPADNVTFSIRDDSNFKTEPMFTLDILNFSDTITKYKFNLNDSAVKLPDVLPATITNTRDMFKSTQFIYGNVGNWNMSNVTDAYSMFRGCVYFNQDISTWDTSSLVNIYRMFEGCSNFNQDLSNWNVSVFDFEPAMFSTGCAKWTLPKPTWGTYPGVDDTPPESYPTDTDKFIFDLERFDNTTTRHEVSIEIVDPVGAWSLKDLDSGVTLVGSQTTSVDSANIFFNTIRGVLNIYIYRSDNLKRKYELTGGGTALRFNSNVFNTPQGEPTSVVNVHTFSNRFNGYKFDVSGLLTVPNYLPPNVNTISKMFNACYHFGQDIGEWDTSNVTNMSQAFRLATRFNCDLSNWNTFNVTDMTDMFERATTFNGNLSNWDVSNVLSMSSMFTGAVAFNGDVVNWNPSSVTTMTYMFNECNVFNQNISKWNVSNVTNMSQMFRNAEIFNQDIGGWNVGNVVDMNYMFGGAYAFKQDLSGWCVGSVPPDRGFGTSGKLTADLLPVWGSCPVNGLGLLITSTDTLDGATPLTLDFKNVTGYWSVKVNNVLIADPHYTDSGVSVTKDLTDLKISLNDLRGVTRQYALRVTCDKLTIGTESYDTLPGTRTVELNRFYTKIKQYVFKVNDDRLIVPLTLQSNLTTLDEMFKNCINFNSDVSEWNTSNITSMSQTFEGCNTFNQDVSKWNVTNVTSMYNLFKNAVKFDQDLTKWNTSSVVNMSGLFNNCSQFDSNLSQWIITNVTDVSYMFNNCGSFNQDISLWDVSNITNMANMFNGCVLFNSGLSTWNTFKVTDMSGMFNGCVKFNNDIGAWQTGRVIDMSNMFKDCIIFNQDLSKWSVANIIAMPNGFNTNAMKWTLSKPIWSQVPENGLMFSTLNIRDVNRELPVSIQLLGRIGGFELVDKLTGKTLVTHDGPVFGVQGVQFENNQIHLNQELSGERQYELRGTFDEISISNNTSYGSGNGSMSITKFSNTIFKYRLLVKYVDFTVPDVLPKILVDLSNMFEYCYGYNQDLSNWDTSHVTNMANMFAYTNAYNQPLNTWNTSNVTDMSGMFKRASVFNQDLNNWDTGSVTNMSTMFQEAYEFNGDVTTWDLREAIDVKYMFNYANLFNQNIGTWVVSRVADMSGMFENAAVFNQDIGDWNTSSVIRMNGMFYSAGAFNQDLSRWCVSNIPSIPRSFWYDNDVWTLPQPSWGTCPIDMNPKGPILESEVNTDWEPTGQTMKFNTVGRTGSNTEAYVKIVIQDPVGAWSIKDTVADIIVADSTGVTADRVYVSDYTTSVYIELMRTGSLVQDYEIDLECKRISLTASESDDSAKTGRLNITQYSSRIKEVRLSAYEIKLTVPLQLPEHFTVLDNFIQSSGKFNQDVSKWNTSNITSMSYLFNGCTIFNQDISNWDVSNVKVFGNMLSGADAFNQDISTWDVSTIAPNSNGLGGGSVDWRKEHKPQWGLVPNRKYVKVDITGQSGTYITLSKNNGPFVTFNLLSPDFNVEEFNNFLILDESGRNITFLDYPGILPVGEQVGIDGTTLCGLNKDGLVVTPQHKYGYLMNGLALGPLVIYAPYTYVNKSTRLTVKHTPRVDSTQDIFYSIPGAVFNSPITLISSKSISLFN